MTHSHILIEKPLLLNFLHHVLPLITEFIGPSDEQSFSIDILKATLDIQEEEETAFFKIS